MAPAGSMWTARHAQSQFSFDGKLWVMGGSDTSGGLVNDVWAVSAPEPGTLVLLGIGLVGLSAYMWRKRRCRIH